jgi:hypothetical protein
LRLGPFVHINSALRCAHATLRDGRAELPDLGNRGDHVGDDAFAQAGVTVRDIAWEADEVAGGQIDRLGERAGAEPPGDHVDVMQRPGCVGLDRLGIPLAPLQAKQKGAYVAGSVGFVQQAFRMVAGGAPVTLVVSLDVHRGAPLCF